MNNHTKAYVFDFENREHFLFLNYLFLYNREKFFNDSITSPEELIKWLCYGQEIGNPLFIYYYRGEPYGLIYADIDYGNIAIVHASTGRDKNFFLNLRILRDFIIYLFKDLGVWKVKAEILVYDLMAEFILRCAGFRKEGLLKDEVKIKGKSQNMLLLAMTKKDFEDKPKNLDKKEIIKIGRLLKK